MMVTPSVRLVRPLGEGGMGSVWVADHEALRTQVVVKFIASELKGSSEAVDRFTREAAAAAQVKSPHVVQTFDHGITTEGVPYIIMELLEGEDLGAFLDTHKRMSPELTVQIVAQLARALDRAHEKGIVHRDIKPGNIFLCYQGGKDTDATREVFVKLLDFGIAKGVEIPKVDSNTKTGAMIGSPFYMSPEQILGSKGVDHRSDLWSVGVVAYEALTGNKPFDAETMGGLAIKIHSEPLPLPSRVVEGLPPSVDAWFQKACARTVDERFHTAKEMAEELARAVGGEMPKSLEVPRISTGNADVSARAPTLVAGAATDAGLTKSASPSSANPARIAIFGLALVALGLGAFFGVKAIKGPPQQAGIVQPPPSAIAPDHSQAGNGTATPPSTLVPATPPTPATVASVTPPPTATHTAGGAHIGHPRPKDSGHTASAPSLTSQTPAPPTQPTVTAPPANSRDIF
jgi:serine/threonine-protein kinase